MPSRRRSRAETSRSFATTATPTVATLLLEWRDGYCYILSTRWLLKGRGVRYRHYLSDLERFWSRFGAVQ